MCALILEAGVSGPGEPGDSRSDSISSEGMESVERDLYEESGAAVLPLAILQESPSRSLFSSSPSSGGPWRMLQDFGLELERVCRKSSRQRLSFLIFLPERLRRSVKLDALGNEATASNAAIEGGIAVAS